jgi:AraC family transcriptional regulator
MYSSTIVARALAQRLAAGTPGATNARVLARGTGWSVKDIVCTHDRHDRPFEERHGAISVALVLAGTFQYRCGHAAEALLAPGALMLGNDGSCFECSHEHAAGDRCVAFHYTPEFFERIAADAGFTTATFGVARVPPLRELGRVSGLVAAKLADHHETNWDDVALDIAARALSLANHSKPRVNAPSRALLARITESIRGIEENPAAPHTLQELAAAAGVGPFYYLRVFERATGITPHQFVLRARLRNAAARIAHTEEQIAGIAFRSGFGDLSNFNHTFRAEFGVTPRQWRSRDHDKNA